ncbi:kinase-like protein [Aspergillus bertholletiae]|uniref:non-specific serine/threonine protein kinase n=1 Tax=Aspergillus bertholletiae TaxID=1226010 RepID=A0A5N7ARK4_9EURO|nr:kinase-like protein [Aspergillus bertholletiae]
MSQPRVFPNSGFYLLDSTARFEEEALPDYLEERYHPVHIGEIFKSQYQVVTKLGFGSSSTVWLCRDLYTQRYLVLKVHVRIKRQVPEVVISKHLHATHSAHVDKNYVRLVLDSFEISGPYGVHPCLLYEPAGADMRDYMRCLEGDALPETLLRPTLRFVLIDLDYLHQASIIHTDIQPNHRIVYRAPEVLLGMDWGNKVDIWALGQMVWTLFEEGHLFRNQNIENETEKARRIAEMISLLGPPPVEFLRRSEEWNWKSSVKIPEQSLENRESRLQTDDQVLFLRFLREALHWLPEERPTATELLFDKWLRGDDY